MHPVILFDDGRQRSIFPQDGEFHATAARRCVRPSVVDPVRNGAADASRRPLVRCRRTRCLAPSRPTRPSPAVAPACLPVVVAVRDEAADASRRLPAVAVRHFLHLLFYANFPVTSASSRN